MGFFYLSKYWSVTVLEKKLKKGHGYVGIRQTGSSGSITVPAGSN